MSASIPRSVLRIPSFMKAIALGLLLVPPAVPSRATESITVVVDQAKLIKLPEKVATIVVGNPLIADITVQRNQVMVVTGKNFGTTNMIALDNKGSIISESQIVVMSPQKDRLIVMRGQETETYACNPDCGPVIQIGDSDRHFGRAGAQSRDRSTNANAGGPGAVPR